MEQFILSEEIVCIPKKRLSDDKIIDGFYIAITISSENHDKLILPIIEASIGGCLSRGVTMLMLGNQILADITLSKLHKTLEACEYKIETRNRLLYPVYIELMKSTAEFILRLVYSMYSLIA